MASVTSEQFLDFNGWKYKVITEYSTGHKIILNIRSVYPWCIAFPDNSIMRFKSESELWQYAIKEKLFKKKRKGKNTWGFQS